MKKEFQKYLLELSGLNENKLTYENVNSFYVNCGCEMQDLFQSININCTSDLLNFLKNKNIEQDEITYHYNKMLSEIIKKNQNHIST